MSDALSFHSPSCSQNYRMYHTYIFTYKIEIEVKFIIEHEMLTKFPTVCNMKKEGSWCLFLGGGGAEGEQ